MADRYLQRTELFDFDSPAVADFVTTTTANTDDRLLQLEQLYYAVRDRFHYEIFGVGIAAADLRASEVVAAGRGFCLHKSILFVAAARAIGIPARLAGTTVVNHISSASIQRLVGGEQFLHWFAEVRLEGTWVKLAPVFNKLLCHVYGITPMDFDVTIDALEHSAPGGRTMLATAPVRYFDGQDTDQILELVAAHHPLMVDGSGRVPSEADFLAPTASTTERSI